jgi:hypothetical protein
MVTKKVKEPLNFHNESTLYFSFVYRKVIRDILEYIKFLKKENKDG